MDALNKSLLMVERCHPNAFIVDDAKAKVNSQR
jgi:hypothetical protein